MKTRIAITDLTRMNRGTVCIAGYTKEHTCVRMILPPPGILESSLVSEEKPIIFPMSLIDVDLLSHRSKPPHTEDWFYDPDSIFFVRKIEDRKTVLQWSLFESISDIFDQPVHTDLGFYVMDCEGSRSLGTIVPRQIIRVVYEAGYEGTWDYRLIFIDRSGSTFRLKITDLTWHYYCDSLRDEKHTPVEISSLLTEILQSSQIFLRIGLARGWQKFPDRCYLQITGIYTFPDYLDGKTFFDLAPYNSTE